MVLLDEKEKEQLKEWIIKQAKELITDSIDPNILANYMMNLVNRGVQYETLISNLEDIIGDETAVAITNRLRETLETGSYKGKAKSQEPAEEPKKVVKEEPKKPKEQPVESKQKQTHQTQVKREDTRPPPRNEEQKKKGDTKYRSRDDGPYEKQQEDRGRGKPDYQDRKGKYDSYDKRDKQQKSKYDEKPKYEKKPKKEFRKRYSSDSEQEYSDDDRDTQKLQLLPEEEPELKPIEKKDRFIIFVAGLPAEYNTIGRIYKFFSKFGRIAGIEEDHADGVCFIEYSKLQYAYRAIKKGAKATGNSLVRVNWAVHPDQAALDALDKEFQEKKLIWEQKTEAEKLINEMQNTYNIKLEEYNTIPDDDDAKKDEIARELMELKKMMDELTQQQS